ncbi:MAG: tRNA pseudouridine(55) synthase TruB [Holosporaceae bacterium]|jgi:tRNA pseudouridine55 synthase|nr:tRNA pseudouridine(55) synthase TruB [Holosporaceae bacterium]
MISGWICLDKPAGMSSNAAMIKVRKILGENTGYVGTLDPFATGVLPIAVGEARKFIRFVEESEKEYVFTVVFGKTTDTLDKDGEIVATTDNIPNAKAISDALSKFVGEIEQIPPAFSAIKINGRRACDRVRNGESVELKSRRIRIFELEMIQESSLLSSASSHLRHCEEDEVRRGNLEKNERQDARLLRRPAPRNDVSGEIREITFRVLCSKGTYVRSLARDIAEKLGSLAYVKTLRRTKSGFFSTNNIISLEKLIEINDTSKLNEVLASVESPLDDIPALYLRSESVVKLRNGLKVSYECFEESSNVKIFDDESGKFCGIGFVSDDGLIKPVRMMCFNN